MPVRGTTRRGYVPRRGSLFLGFGRRWILDKSLAMQTCDENTRAPRKMKYCKTGREAVVRMRPDGSEIEFHCEN